MIFVYSRWLSYHRVTACELSFLTVIIESFPYLEKVVTVPNMKDEFDSLLVRISSPKTRKAGDAFFSADPLDLSLTYSPDNFDSPDTQPDSKSSDTICKK